MANNPNHEDVVLPPGEIIAGKYQIISKLGQGGMGVVYRAKALSLHREVAVKMLTHVDETTLRRFEREALTLGRITHRAVVRVDDFGDSGRWGPYLAMAYVPGRDLAALVERGPIPPQEAVDITLAVCSGISACHGQSIIHRDLKPTNVRVTEKTEWTERVKILDFGLALPFDSPILKAYQTRITHLGAGAGTPRFIAPELLRHQAPTPHCDQYGIAALLYLLLTGRAPYHEFEGDQLIAAILGGRYASLGHARPEISTSLQRAVTRALHLEPEKRFPSVDDFALAILPDASSHLQKAWTRYFANARAVDRRLIEPVSAYRPAPPAPVPIIVAPIPDPPDHAPKSPEEVAPEGARRLLTPPAPPSLPVQHRAHRVSRQSNFHTLFVFTCGLAVGCALTVASFICFLLYQRNTACPQPVQAAPHVIASPRAPSSSGP